MKPRKKPIENLIDCQDAPEVHRQSVGVRLGGTPRYLENIFIVMLSNAIFGPTPDFRIFIPQKKSHSQISSHLSLSKLNPQSNEQFPNFLEKLRGQSPKEWGWLVRQFRNRLMPVLVARAKNLSSSASLITPQEFAEEVFEECLLKFYELFENGVFEKYGDLEATIVRISDFKLKEGFAKIKRDQKLYFMDAEALAVMREKHLKNADQEEKEKAELIGEIHKYVNQLPEDESDILLRFFNGEDLKHIAEDYGISPAACRKRKQRIVEKLRGMILKYTGMLLLLMLT